MELTEQMKEKISKGVWQRFYPVNERHPLIKALEMLGAPQKEMAEALEISKQAMSFYLTGQRPLPAKHEKKLCGLLMFCQGSAGQVIKAMERNREADELGPFTRKATEEEFFELKRAFEFAGKAIAMSFAPSKASR